MKIFNNIKIPKNFKGSALAIGNFDGVPKSFSANKKNSEKKEN